MHSLCIWPRQYPFLRRMGGGGILFCALQQNEWVGGVGVPQKVVANLKKCVFKKNVCICIRQAEIRSGTLTS